MPNKKNQINLIPQDEFEVSTLGRILKWALSTFRVVVIVTELIVMSAFLSRFWLDAKNSDLNETINVSKSQISAFSAIESTFRTYQNKLSIVKSLYSQKTLNRTITSVLNLIPTDITLITISVTGNTVQIKASSFSEMAISQFLVNLGASKEFGEVNLSQVSSGIDNISSNNMIFSISAERNKNGN